MSVQNYLLTYASGTMRTFAWFESEQEMNEFIDTENIFVLEKIHIKEAHFME